MSVKVTISSYASLNGLSESTISSIKKRLTFKNPQYEKVKKYSRYSYTKVPPYLEYFESYKGGLRVPVGFDFDSIPEVACEGISIKETRVCPTVKVPEFALTLRPTQKEAVESYIRQNKTHVLNGCVQLPTGKGKSILGLYLASFYKTRTLIVVHKDDLVRGWKKDIDLAFDGKVNPGLIKAQNRRVGEFITIATIQTLNLMSEESRRILYDQFGLIIQDEMHHCPASSFGIVNEFNARYRLGLTATPERTDGLAHIMNLYFGGFCYKYKLAEDEVEEDILPVRVIVKNTKAYFDPLCRATKLQNGFSYSIANLAYPEDKEAPKFRVRLSEVPYESRPSVQFFTIDDLVVRQVIEQVCEDVLNEYNQGHSCIVFLSQKEHCKLYYDYLRQFVSENHIGLLYGDNPNNNEVLEEAESIRKYITITTYSKSTEGTNVKQWEVAFLVSSINNEKNTEQAVGRVRRTKPGVKMPVALVYDYRYPKALILSRHGATRDKRYKALGFDVPVKEVPKSLFRRGFNYKI